MISFWRMCLLTSNHNHTLSITLSKVSLLTQAGNKPWITFPFTPSDSAAVDSFSKARVCIHFLKDVVNSSAFCWSQRLQLCCCCEWSMCRCPWGKSRRTMAPFQILFFFLNILQSPASKRQQMSECNPACDNSSEKTILLLLHEHKFQRDSAALTHDSAVCLLI